MEVLTEYKFLNPISQINQNTSSKDIGGKAYNLAKIRNLGLNIPKTFVIPVSIFDNFIKKPAIIKLLEEVNFDNLFEKVDSILEYLKNTETQNKTELKKLLIEDFQLIDFKKMAIRSSANVEDGNKYSFAGQFDSVLNVKNDLNSIVNAIYQVYYSVFTIRSISYCLANNINPSVMSMAVIIQKMIPSLYSGTSFTKDILTNTNNEIIIESTGEGGSKVVDGSGITNVYKFNKENIINSRGPSFIKKLAKLSLGIEANYQIPLDIEWAFDGKDLFILQTRAITT